MKDSWKLSSTIILAVLFLTYAVVGGVIGYAVTFLFGGGGWIYGAVGFSLIALVITVYSCLRPVNSSMRDHKTVQVDANTEPRLYKIVENLAEKAGAPMPKVYVDDTRIPNAYALGRSPDDASVCATRATMNILNDEELEGIMAHELSHIMHRDTIVCMIARNSARTLSISATIMRFLSMFGLGALNATGDSRTVRKSSFGPFIYLLLFIVLVPAILCCAVFALALPSAGLIMNLGMSRSREYGADESAARLTGKPMALANGLMKLERGCNVDSNEYNDATSSSMWTVNPFGRNRNKFLSKLMSTHPPTEDRVARLRKIDEELRSNRE